MMARSPVAEIRKHSAAQDEGAFALISEVRGTVSSKNPMIKINNNFYLTIAVAVSIGIFFVAGQISGTLNSTGLHGLRILLPMLFSEPATPRACRVLPWPW